MSTALIVFFVGAVIAQAVAKPAVVPVLIDVNAVALMLNCSARHVYRLEAEGALPKRRQLGNLVRWSQKEIEQWIADGCPVVK